MTSINGNMKESRDFSMVSAIFAVLKSRDYPP